jgi:hypothetical protein
VKPATFHSPGHHDTAFRRSYGFFPWVALLRHSPYSEKDAAVPYAGS